MVRNNCRTFPFQSRNDISIVAVCPKSILLLAIDAEGHSYLYNLITSILLARFNFKGKVSAAAFSPDGTRIAVAINRSIQIWFTPESSHREFLPFDLDTVYNNLHREEILSIAWSPDADYLLSTSADMTAKLTYRGTIQHRKKSILLSAHKHKVISGYFFETDSSDKCKEIGIITLGLDSVAYFWKLSLVNGTVQPFDSSDPQRLGKIQRLFISAIVSEEDGVKSDLGHLTSTAFAFPNYLLCGFKNGAFALYQILSSFELVVCHALSMTSDSISTCSISKSGSLLSFASPPLSFSSNIAVWNWKSESFALRHQSHSSLSGKSCMNTFCLSPNDQIITGDSQGMVKVWDSRSGSCIATLNDHQAAICSLFVCKQNRVLLSASADGIIQATDLNHFRAFKKLTTPTPVRFSSMTADSSGEFVVAGTLDTFQIFVWSLQSGQIIDILAGHEGPIQALKFDENRQRLASASWDHSVRIWDLFSRNKSTQVLSHDSEVLALDFHPSGQELVSTTLSGLIYVWDVEEGVQLKTIEAHNDAWANNKSADVTQLMLRSKISFGSISYSPDGTSIITGGKSPYILMYDVPSKILLKRFLIEQKSDKKQPSNSIQQRKGKLQLDNEINFQCFDLKFSRSGDQWVALTDEGLLIYSLNNEFSFDPFDLDAECTPASIRSSIQTGDFIRAMSLSLRLSDDELTSLVYLSVPLNVIPILVRDLSPKYLPRLLSFIAFKVLRRSETSAGNDFAWRQIERSTTWCETILSKQYSSLISNTDKKITSYLHAIEKSMAEIKKDFDSYVSETCYLVDALLEGC